MKKSILLPLISTITLILMLFFGFAFFPSGNVGFSGTSKYEEISRSMIIYGMYIIFFLNYNKASIFDNRISFRFSKLIIYSLYILLFISFLQSFHILPSQYYQWVQGQHIARPSGGLTHPHYYAFLNSIGMAFALFLYKSNKINKNILYIFCVLMLIGALISTSRTGSIICLISLIFVAKSCDDMRVHKVLKYFIFIFIFIFIFYISYREEVNSYINVFFDFLTNHNGIFRSRDKHWLEEIEFITMDLRTFILGYGYQPVVSHNIVLRQMQVSGLLGLFMYSFTIFSMFYVSIKGTDVRFRGCIYIALTSLLLGSITTSYLISLPLNSIIILLLFICSSYEDGEFSKRSVNRI